MGRREQTERKLRALMAAAALLFAVAHPYPATAMPGDKITIEFWGFSARLQATIDLGAGQVLRQSPPMGVRKLAPAEWRQLTELARLAANGGLETARCKQEEAEAERLHKFNVQPGYPVDGGSLLEVEVEGKGAAAPNEPRCLTALYHKLWSAADLAARAPLDGSR